MTIRRLASRGRALSACFAPTAALALLLPLALCACAEHTGPRKTLARPLGLPPARRSLTVHIPPPQACPARPPGQAVFGSGAQRFVVRSARRVARVELQLVSALEDARATGDAALGRCIEAQIDRVRVLRRKARGLLAARRIDDALALHAERSCASARALQHAARRCLTLGEDDGRTVVQVIKPQKR